MFDRQWIGDVLLAVLIAIPSVALARPETVPHHRPVTAIAEQSTVALASAADRQVGIFR